MNGYFDSFAGLVPARMLTCWCDLRTRTVNALIRVTRDHRAYKKDEELVIFAHDYVEPVVGGWPRCRTVLVGDAMGYSN